MTAVKVKIMPSSLEANIEDIQEKVRKVLEKKGAKNISFEIEEVAFGLKAIIATLAWPENLETEEITSALEKIEDVSSASIIDYRRAFG